MHHDVRQVSGHSHPDHSLHLRAFFPREAVRTLIGPASESQRHHSVFENDHSVFVKASASSLIAGTIGIGALKIDNTAPTPLHSPRLGRSATH